jgi:enamine deaminase RidA (YjgF/YER057c/UK114 family)
MTIERHGIGELYSHMVVHGDVVYTSGLVARDGSTGVAAQTKAILAQIDESLASVGSDKSKLLTANIWLADVRDWDEMNTVWTAWIDPEQPPVRATVGAMIAKREYRVEIMVTAAR